MYLDKLPVFECFAGSDSLWTGFELSAVFVVRFFVVVRGSGGGRLPWGRVTLAMDDDAVHAETLQGCIAWLDHAGLGIEGDLIADCDSK